jgi:hypothetical protein
MTKFARKSLVRNASPSMKTARRIAGWVTPEKRAE